MKLAATILIVIALAVPGLASPQQLTINSSKRASLVAVAFTGTCSVFAAIPYKKISPSVTDIEIWQTCEVKLPSFWYGPDDYFSAAYLVRVDCGRKEFATVAYAYYSEKFWAGGVVAQGEIREPFWRALSLGFTELERQCLPEGDSRRSLRKFDGPDSKRNL